MLVLALEASTSAAKALLYDTERGVVRVSTSPFPQTISRGGVSQTEQITRWTLENGAKVAAGQPVAAIALCGTWHNVAVCEENLCPLGETYSWDFVEPQASCAQLCRDEARTDWLYRRTGCMVHSSYPRQQLLYLWQQGMELSNRRLMSQGGHLFYTLTGTWCESVSMASGSGLVNLQTLQYDEEVLNWMQLRKAQLPPLVSYEQTCPLTIQGAQWLGLQPGIPVVPPYPDGALNQLAAGAMKPGRMTLSVGTSAALRVAVDAPVLPQNRQLWCYYGVNGWITGAAVSGAGNCINWFLRDCLQGKWSYGDFEKEIGSIADLPVFLPFLFGERCPGWQSGRMGGFVDVLPEHGILELYKGMQLGILENLLQCYTPLTDMTGKPERILVSGGILHAPQWLQMLADVFEQAICCDDMVHASTMGAVALALTAAGAAAQPENALSNCLEQMRQVVPNPERSAYYRHQYERYLRWYAKTT